MQQIMWVLCEEAKMDRKAFHSLLKLWNSVKEHGENPMTSQELLKGLKGGHEGQDNQHFGDGSFQESLVFSLSL